MNSPGRYDIGADRWVACIRNLSFVGVDFTGATFIAQVRLTPDAPGAALVDLSTVLTSSAEGVRLVYGGTDTVANHIAAERMTGAMAEAAGLEPADAVALSQVGLRINETTMEGLPFPDERGDDLALAWDMHITPSGGVKDKWIGGTFTVRAGATQ